jgi:hypothetical protein
MMIRKGRWFLVARWEEIRTKKFIIMRCRRRRIPYYWVFGFDDSTPC